MGFYSVLGGHGINLPESLFKQHPEYFAEIGGKRYPDQVCFSNPETLRLITERVAREIRGRPYLDIVGMHPSDNPHACRCADLAKTDASTAWFDFHNRMTDALKKEFPHLKFTAVAYSFYRDVPKCPIRNCEFIAYASYDRCNVHPYGHPDCHDNEQTLRNLLAWQATGLPIGDYTYEHGVCVTTSLNSERQVRFFPFLSLIDNAVKTSRKLDHVAVTPEVTLIGLLPKYKTLVPREEYVYQVQHRLTCYLYGRGSCGSRTAR